jgi:hypothetical protein
MEEATGLLHLALSWRSAASSDFIPFSAGVRPLVGTFFLVA